MNKKQKNKFSGASPSFGPDAAGPACDGAVDVGKVGVIPGVEPRANLFTHKGFMVVLVHLLGTSHQYHVLQLCSSGAIGQRVVLRRDEA